MQEFKIEDAGDSACTIHQKTNSGCTHLSIPLPKAELVAGIVAILSDGDAREMFVDTVLLTKNTTNVTAHVGSASFAVPLTHITQLVL
ncbi:hypothetical protein [Falsiruegeria litorea]|uniref:hypothetical protein n=1 Tax=Falsiruegeria litorea TaxID=1280831 RepID=UPI001BFE89AE|nr:hypothetical protein [Falsiruegeria litorea]MBT8167626.1 hypothetical protein [Falsiruegeria litorea]